MDVSPIETWYGGNLYASRAEARWAVAFEMAGVPFQYEPEGFKLETDWYLPDFWLAGDIGAYFEVKPEGFQMGPGWYVRERLVAEDLATQTRKVVYAACGGPSTHRTLLRFRPDAIMPMEYAALRLLPPHALSAGYHHHFPRRGA